MYIFILLFVYSLILWGGKWLVRGVGENLLIENTASFIHGNGSDHIDDA